ncbi:MAG: hypothetical protein LKJ90_06385 [Faecalibacterium sp.]|jgi:hypothetical protein|nr:hypothetical protein [Faecalibacterium sp.]
METEKNKQRRVAYRRFGVAALWLLALAAFSLALGVRRLAVCDYVSVDGDWQSYNVFRRMLAGQRPYTDFANYIGMAPVVCNLPLLALLGGSFAQSLFVTNVTANVLFSLAVFCLFYLVTQKALPSMAASAVFSKLVSTQIFSAIPGGAAGAWLNETFTGLYTPSNSMRVARSWLPFLLVLGILLWNRLCPQHAWDVRESFSAPRRAAACGAVLGFCITWSSDYGLACIAAASVIFVLLHLCRYRAGVKRFLVCLAAYTLALAVGVFASAALVTGGAPGAWFASLAATGQAQYYYFNGTGSRPAISYLFTCGRFWLGAAVCLVFLLFCTVRLIQKKLSANGLLLYFLMASVLAGTVAYILAGSGYNAREPLEGYSAILALAGAVRGVYALAAQKNLLGAKAAPRLAAGRAAHARMPAERILAGLCAAVLAGSCLLCGRDALAARRGIGTSGTQIPALGGTSTYTAALCTADTLTGGDAVFSVYATGLETVKGQFQPTGYDYIIHALGQNAQNAYSENFAAGEYRWVQTPNLPVDGWLALQNWYFYRQVWRYYDKVQATEYSWLWQRAGDKALGAEVSVCIQDNGDGSVTLSCQSDTQGAFIADVEVEYALTGGDALQKALNLGRGAVYAATGSLYADDDTYTGFCLPASGRQYVPVVMQNGSGSVRLSSLYTGGGTVTVNSAACADALPRWNLHTADAAG